MDTERSRVHKLAANSQNTLELKMEERGERLKPAVLKDKIAIRYLTENSTKSLCQPQDSEIFNFLDLLFLCSFCPSFSDNLVTLWSFWPVAHRVSHS